MFFLLIQTKNPKQVEERLKNNSHFGQVLIPKTAAKQNNNNNSTKNRTGTIMFRSKLIYPSLKSIS